jgi:Sugar (and other) transporter
MSMIVLEYLFPLFFVIMYPFFPESPYWLIKNGKFDEARKSLNRIHGSRDQAFIDFEMKRLTEEVRESQELAEQTKLKGPPYLQIFQGENLVWSPDQRESANFLASNLLSTFTCCISTIGRCFIRQWMYFIE